MSSEAATLLRELAACQTPSLDSWPTSRALAGQDETQVLRVWFAEGNADLTCM